MNFSFLSSFFLDLYLSELDFYVFSLLSSFSFKIVLGSNISNNLSAPLNKTIERYKPIKLSTNLFNFGTVRNLLFDRYSQQLKSFPKNFTLFAKNLNFLRHKNFFLGCLIGNNDFLLFFRKKVLSFVRSSLILDIKDLSDLTKKNVLFSFLNFDFIALSSSELDYSYLGRLKSSKKYFLRVFTRIKVYKSKISKNFISRVNFELVDNINIILKSRFINNLGFDKGKIWVYLLQLEAVRSLQYNKLVMTKEKQGAISREVFLNARFKSIFDYQKYLFSLYIQKLQFSLKKCFQDFNFSFNSSLFISREIDCLFLDYQKYFYLFYNSFFYNFRDKSFINTNFIDSNNNFVLSMNLFKKDYYNLNSKSKHFNVTSSFILECLVPLDFCISRLRFLGFLHTIKARPIGNSNYLGCEDLYIIKVFGFMAFRFLFWYRCCFNFVKVRKLVSLLRESCFLTLSRKHNKTKFWAYNVYTSDLQVLSSLFTGFSFFPTRRVVSKLGRKFLFSDKKLLFDEKFFLGS